MKAMQDEFARERREDLARRLAAASVSHQLGLSGVDRTLKQFGRRGPIGEYWMILAQLVERDAQSPADRMPPLRKKPHLRLEP